MNRRPLRPAAALAVTWLLAGSLAACTPADSATSGDTVTVGTLRAQPHLFTPFFYDDFAPEGTEFEVVVFDTSTDIKNAVVSGSVDFGVTGAPSVLAGVAAEQGVRIVASSADGGTRIVGSPDIEDPEDLVGRSVGYPMGSSQEILLKLTLAAHGIDPADVELVNLPFAEMAGAYESGQIDAMSSAEMGPSIAMEAGAAEIVSPYETPVGKVNIVLATSEELIESDPELVQQVVDTHIQASEHLAASPEEWATGLVEEFGLDPAVVERALTNVWPRWELDDAYQAQVFALADEMVAFDQLDGAPDTSRIFDPTFVEASTYAD